MKLSTRPIGLLARTNRRVPIETSIAASHLSTHTTPPTTCRAINVSTVPQVYTPTRLFSSSTSLLKKRKAPAPTTDSNSNHKTSPPPAPTTSNNASSSGQHQPNPEDPLNFTSVTSAYAASDVHFKAILQSVLHGGRFNPDSLGALPINIKSSDDGSTSTEAFPLSELAQIVPRAGRTISILVSDRAFIKPIMSAVQASKEFNQQPQRAEDNELELLLKVELERKEELVRRIKEATQAWRERVRQARTKHEKALKDWKKSGAVLPDLVRKADKELQKLQDKKMKDIDQEEAHAIKQLERNA